METHSSATNTHVLLLPYPSQGHINPMYQFGKRLASYGLHVTIAITRFIAKSTPMPSSTSVHIDQISDGHDTAGFAEAKCLESYHDGLKSTGSLTLKEAIERHKAEGYPVDCVVYDAFLPWALSVTKEMGLLGAAFFTQPCTVDAIYYDVCKTNKPLPFTEREVSMPELPMLLELKDMPSFMVQTEPYLAYRALVLDQFSNLDKADVVLFNTVHEFESEVAHWFKEIYTAKTIGPTIPSEYLDKRMEGDNRYGFDLFPIEQLPCMTWLSSNKNRTIVYVACGSMAKLSQEQMDELAWGLQEANTLSCGW